MGNGQWAIGNGQWAMGNGQWGIGNGQWAMENVINTVPHSFYKRYKTSYKSEKYQNPPTLPKYLKI